MSTPRMLMFAPAPVFSRKDGYILDAKFVEGMKLHQKFWPGTLECVLREGAGDIPFGARQVPENPGFALRVLGQEEMLTEGHLAGYDVIYCSADDVQNLDIPALATSHGAKVVFTLEYTLQTRLQIAKLDPGRGLVRRAYSMLWLIRQEWRRRRVLKRADGLQVNGYPAFHAYRRLAPNIMLYLDNRMAPGMFVTEPEIAARADRLGKGAALRLVYSGRLEPMKGAQDLVPIASKLQARGLAFGLDIFGAGSLKHEIKNQIETAGLGEVVRLHEPVDFETELVPHLRAHADIYLCCHRQSDPSCTYLENMGCGLAVVGYGNRMWAELCAQSGAGWQVPLGDRDGLADILMQIDKDRQELVARCAKAHNFAKAHDFKSEFRKRMDHLADTAVQPTGYGAE